MRNLTGGWYHTSGKIYEKSHIYYISYFVDLLWLVLLQGFRQVLLKKASLKNEKHYTTSLLF